MVSDISRLFLDFNCMLYIALFLMKKQELCHPQKSRKLLDQGRQYQLVKYQG